MFQQLLFWKEVGDDLIIKCERSSATNIKALGDRPVSNEYYIYTKRTGVLFDCPFLSFCKALAAALCFDYRDRNICCGLIENVVWLLSPELLVLFNSLCAFGIYVAFSEYSSITQCRLDNIRSIFLRVALSSVLVSRGIRNVTGIKQYDNHNQIMMI